MVKTVLATAFLLCALTASAASDVSFRTLQPEAMREDFLLMKRALTELHPGLYRYNTPEEMATKFGEFEAELKKPMREDRFFLLLSRFLSGIKCGHTYTNPFNQKKETFGKFTDGSTYIPFYFKFIDGFFIVTGNASAADVAHGTAITSINGADVDEIVNALHSVTLADGNGTNLTRIRQIGIDRETGGSFNVFDIFFPILYPPVDGKYTVRVMDIGGGGESTVMVPAMTKEERAAAMEKRYGKSPSYDDGWSFRYLDDGTGYLKIDNFITWRLSIDWKKFVADAFREMRAKGTTDLIIDIRESDGGDGTVVSELLRHLHREPFGCDRDVRTYIRTAKADPDILKHSDGYGEVRKALADGLPESMYRKADNGLLEYLEDEGPCAKTEPSADRFAGKSYMLIGPNNASAAFTLAYKVKEAGLATLVGGPTGGNLNGFNGGAYLFVNLPNSGFEFDIPIFAYYPADPARSEDSGVAPDVNSSDVAGDIASGYDRALEKVRELIRNERRK